jgi:hypothetical protein
MKIIIQPKENSSILKKIPVSIDAYTIFAGENNSGKTNLIKGIIDELGGEDKVIYIPAENIDPKENIKTGTGTDRMTKAISNLLKIVLDKIPVIDGNFKELFKNIKENFDTFGINNTKLELSEKVFKKENFEKWIKDNVAKSILESKIIDSYYDKDKNFDVTQVGQGIQRLIIISIIQEIGRMDSINNSEEKILLFEEPEIYLHPKLKEKLYESLIKISTNSNIKVLITTHDPYFIQLNEGQNVYRVTRDQDGATYIDNNIKKYLPKDWRSFSEINYQVFNVNGEDYLNELYGHLEDDFGCWTKVDAELEKKGQAKDQKRNYCGNSLMTIGSAIRHEIHHRTKETLLDRPSIDDTIEKLQKILISNKSYNKKVL